LKETKIAIKTISNSPEERMLASNELALVTTDDGSELEKISMLSIPINGATGSRL
jgi:hypothetical protein